MANPNKKTMIRILEFASRFGFVLLTLWSLQGVTYVQGEEGIYSIVVPGSVRSNLQYNVAVSVHKADAPCTFNLAITGPGVNKTKSVVVSPEGTENVIIDLPSLSPGEYNFTAEGVSGIVFTNTTKLNFESNDHMVFIQTDKAIYKPGDLVQFRVLFLDANTRPLDPGPVTIEILDAEKNRVKQFSKVNSTNGLLAEELQLSEQPVLGDWTIEVFYNVYNISKPVERKQFEVAKYVLPKFEVTIDTARDVAIPDGVIKATIRAKYTYGKPVKGKATVSLKPIYNYFGGSASDLQAQKTVQIDGKGHVEFDLNKDLRIVEHAYVPPLRMLAVVEEELTGNKLNATAQVTMHKERYRLEAIDMPKTFNASETLVIKIVVKKVDGTVALNIKDKLKLILSRVWTPLGGARSPLVFTSEFNDQGIATFRFTLPDKTADYYSVQCELGDTHQYLESISSKDRKQETLEDLKVTVNTEKPRLGEEVSLEVTSKDNIPYFVYTILGRGNILKSERVDLPKGLKYHEFKIMPTFEMMPKAKVFVHYVRAKHLRFDETTIEFDKAFENHIDIEAPAQAKPGEEITLNIKTDPDSTVGLLGIDQSALLLKSGNDLDKDKVFHRIEGITSQSYVPPGFGRYPGVGSGVVTMTNAHYYYNIAQMEAFQVDDDPIFYVEADEVDSFTLDSVASSSETSDTASESTAKVRKDFAETWIWHVGRVIAQHSLKGNDYTLTRKIPDTITSWVVTGFSLNAQTGLALTDNPSKIQVFQPFFMSINLPYSVKRGEVIAIPVIIFNYMDKALDAEVVMDNSDKEYEFTEATNEVEDSPIDEVKRTKRVTIPSNSGHSVSFMIRPTRVGPVTLKITAVSPLAGDTIHQKLRVDPEGVTQYGNGATFVNLKEDPSYTETLKIDIPEDAIPESEFMEFSVVGDILGPTIQNLDKLVRMPYGCGEQNMVNFVPNILVLRYLNAIGKQMPTLATKAKKFMEVGYQRELGYKHSDGSYSAFGKADKMGSTWLTAYVVRSFHQAAKYIDIDTKVIGEGLRFLASTQAENGSFVEYGKLFDSSHQNELGLTSFVLLAFLENIEHVPEYKNAIEKGFVFLIDNVDESDDIYALSIAVSALQLGESPKAEKLLAQLESVAQTKSNRKWWSKGMEDQANRPPWLRPQSNDVEITAYILSALLEKESPEAVLPIVQWLIAQRNSNGGFTSTQDTVVGLQALIKFAEKTGAGSGDMKIRFTSYDKAGKPDNEGVIEVNADNALILQTHVLPKSTRSLTFTAEGKGSALAQLSYRYNQGERDPKSSFKVNTSVKARTARLLSLEVCASYEPLAAGNASAEAVQQQQSNMAVMEVALPSGYAVDSDAFDKIQSVGSVRRVESTNSASTVIIYFDGLQVGAMNCLPIESSKEHAVAKQKPASVSVYDYYEPARRATEFYEVQSSLCDICEGDDCGAGCKDKK